jgi:phytoene synthase
MQLSNIARDVGEDARFGRLYLPRQWLREAGVDPERFLAAPEPSAAIADIVRRLLAQADLLYRRAESGIARLPVGCRPGIYAARLLYAEIGAEVARRGFDGVSARAVVSPMRKMKLLMRVQGTLMLSTEHLQAPVLPETRFLIEAAAAAPFTASTAKSLSGGPIRRAGRRLVWMLELFEELDRRERLRALSASSAEESLA